MGIIQEFNINELAGATGLILGAISGILVVIFKSRCHCKFRIGISDKYNICMCERKPPPDEPHDSDDEEKKKPTPTTSPETGEPLVPTTSQAPEPEPEIATKKP
jgi:hypothetical protein